MFNCNITYSMLTLAHSEETNDVRIVIDLANNLKLEVQLRNLSNEISECTYYHHNTNLFYHIFEHLILIF